MSTLLYSDASGARIAQYVHRLPQAVLFSGMLGIGLYTTAYDVARGHGDVLVVRPQLLTKTSTVPQISIEAVRDLYEQTRTRSARGRVIIIDDVDKMTVPAQNAFLKLLEEPNPSTKFILTSHQPEALLPTIKSRLESLHLTPISSEQTSQLIDSLPGITAQKRAQLRFIADGLPAELSRLVEDDMSFREKASVIGTAKKLIEGNSYTQTVLIHKEKLTRHSADILAEQLVRLLSRQPTARGVRQIERLLTARERIAAGGNVKLQLLAAMV